MAHIAQFKPLKQNPNKHTQRGLRALDDSIRQDGYTEPMVAAADGTVLSGNARLERVVDVLGLDVEPIIVESDGTRPIIHVRTDISGEDTDMARRIAVRANRVGQIDLEWDIETLVGLTPDELLTSLWTPEELSDLGAGLDEDAPEDPGAQIDKADELRQKWGVELGQMWALGEHRLICGDCTDAAVVARVMGGEKADMGFFDPPYGISFQSNGRTATPKFDVLDGDDKIDASWLSLAVESLSDGGAL